MAKKRIMWMLGATIGGGAAAQRPAPKADSATVVVTLRVMDAETGRPMPAPALQLGCRTQTGQVCSVRQRVESASQRREGVVKFEVSGDAFAIYEASAKLQDCNVWAEPAAGELSV